jgi:MraZ protein
VSAGGLFSGNILSVADSKGRFALPSAMRALVRQGSGGEPLLCLNTHASWPCLTGFGTIAKQQMLADIDREEERMTRLGRDYDRDAAMMRAFAMVEDVGFDEGGRFFLPLVLRLYAKIGDKVMLVAMGRQITLWHPETLLATDIGNPAVHVAARLQLEAWENSPRNPARKGAA